MKQNKFFTRQKLFKLLFESFLIVFSVLFALFLNEYSHSVQENKLKNIAVKNVEKELQNNLRIVKLWLPYHKKVLNNLQLEISHKTQKLENNSDKLINLGALMPAGLIQSLIDDTSWETLKSSPVISTLDYTTLLTLSKIYDFQNMGVQKTINTILKELTSREILRKELAEESLVLLYNDFSELIAQEVALIQSYEQVLKNLENK